MSARLLDGRGVIVPAALLAGALAYGAARAPLIAVAGLGAALLLLLVLVWAEAVLLLLVAVLPWEDLLAYPTETISAVKVLGLLLAGAWTLRALERRSEVRLPSTLGPVAVFGLLVGASLLLSPDPVAGLDKALRYALFIVFFFLVVQLTGDRASVRRFLRVLTLSASGAAVWALVNFLGGELDRAAGPIQDPNDFAYLMATVLPLAAFLFAEEPRRRMLWGACLAVMLAATLATLSRGALVGLAALAIWAVASRRVPIVGVLAGLFTFAAVLLVALFFWSPLIEERVDQKGEVADRNAATRLAFWDAAALMAYDHPIVGVGPARFGEETDNYLLGSRSDLSDPVVHNSYLEIAAENGIPALLAFAAFLAGSAALLSRGRRRSEAADDREGVRLATALQAAFVVALVSAAFLSQQLALPLWLVGALAVTIAAEGRAVPGAPARPAPSLRAVPA
jgi:putative inorganic carbon (hco3(-)) transporter